MTQFELKIKFNEGKVNMYIEGDNSPQAILLTLAQSATKIIKETVETSSYRDAFNFFMSHMKELLDKDTSNK